MDYPGEFNVPAFPAGSQIAISRVMGIGVLVVCLLIIFICGMILWATSARTVDPFVISVNSITGEWEIVESVGHSHGQNKYTLNQFAQISTVNRFVQDWFYISPDASSNDARWDACDDDACANSNNVLYGGKECMLYCMSGADLFTDFSTNIVSDYQNRADNGEYWFIKSDSIQIIPAGEITAFHGIWRVTATIMSNMGDFQILGYANVDCRNAIDSTNTDVYPLNFVQTMGCKVMKFNSYRIN